MKNMKEYLSQFKPSMNREGEKYYTEMQELAYNLVKYLKMNENKSEYKYQGNYNLTYLKENMTNDDYKYIVDKFMRNLSYGEIQELIKNWSNNSYDIVFNDETEENNNPLLGCGKKYEILYFRGGNYRESMLNNKYIQTAKGTLIKYDNPFTGRFFLENDNGAIEIIPMVGIIEMREIV